MNKLLFVALIIFSSYAMANNASSLVADELKENVWVIDYITDDSVRASVNGQVTHGDRFGVRFVKDSCDTGNPFTTVYTVSSHPDISKLENQYVTSEFMGQKTIGKILFMLPFLNGHSATVDFGSIPKEKKKKILLRENLITMKYVDSKNIKITDYFDIIENSWVNVGLGDALERAFIICEMLSDD